MDLCVRRKHGGGEGAKRKHLAVVRDGVDLPTKGPWKTTPAGLRSLAGVGRRVKDAEVVVICTVPDRDGSGLAVTWMRASVGMTRRDTLWMLERAKGAVLAG